MLKEVYKNILRKMNLSSDELKELESKLTVERISYGPYIRGERTCPNTTALQVKFGAEYIQTKKDVQEYLKKNHVGKKELLWFYILFDLPSLMSKKQFTKKLKVLQQVVREMYV